MQRLGLPCGFVEQKRQMFGLGFGYDAEIHMGSVRKTQKLFQMMTSYKIRVSNIN